MFVFYLPLVILAFTITTDYKVGDTVYTNVDVAQHQILSHKLKNEAHKTDLAPEDTLEGKALIKQYLTVNNLRFTPQERQAMFDAYLQRMSINEMQFDRYLKDNNITKEVFIEELAYRQELSRWMVQTYSWREVASKEEISTLKNKIKKEAQETQIMSFTVMKKNSLSDFPEHITDSFWEENAANSTSYVDVTLKSVPEPYEAFLMQHKTGDVSAPIEAYNAWHVVKITSKSEIQLPSDDMLSNYIVEQKCMKHLSEWTREHLSWIYKS